MNTIHISYFKTDLTEFILGSFEGKLCLADIGAELNATVLINAVSFKKVFGMGYLRYLYGETLTYLELSKNIGNEKDVRAVANANAANAISIVILVIESLIQTKSSLVI